VSEHDAAKERKEKGSAWDLLVSTVDPLRRLGSKARQDRIRKGKREKARGEGEFLSMSSFRSLLSPCRDPERKGEEKRFRRKVKWRWPASFRRLPIL